MTVVVYASVILKWLFDDPERESQTQEATSLMQAVVDGHVEVLQPIHWAIEVAAVLARKTPNTAEDNVRLLTALDLATVVDEDILLRACRLSVKLDHHLFDTLYHAVALERSAVLITADEHYRRKAERMGHIRALADWAGSD